MDNSKQQHIININTRYILREYYNTFLKLDNALERRFDLLSAAILAKYIS
jgi:hypothetical protein